MSNKLPTPRQRELLLLAYQYGLDNNGWFPDNVWLGQQLGQLSRSGVSNLKRILKEKGYIDEREGVDVLTQKAYDYLKNSQSDGSIVIPLEIKVLGTVEAGPRESDDAAVIMLDSIDDAPTLVIPGTSTETNIFLLQVKGRSMESERIFDEDYVIVERFGNNEKPKQNELIVTMYLPPNVEPYEDWNDEWFDGPTVKYYFETQENGKVIYRLSPRKDAHKNPYTIKTVGVRPVGRVVSVYRSI